jgi:hypothetical protein
MPIPIPLMEDENIADMLRRAAAQAGMIFSDKAIATATHIARGSPDVAQCLGLRITQATLERGDDLVLDQDLLQAVVQLLQEGDPKVASRYDALAGTDALGAALESAASGVQDDWGVMRVVRNGEAVSVGGQSIPGPAWARLQELGVLTSPDGDENAVHFADRALLHHVQLVAARRQLQAEHDAGLLVPEAAP